MINLIFRYRSGASGLAHTLDHRVIGLTLPPIDANALFIKRSQLVWVFGEGKTAYHAYTLQFG